MDDFKKRAGLILFALVAAVVVDWPAAAEDMALTPDSVSRFLVSFSEMRAIAIVQGAQAGMDVETSNNPVRRHREGDQIEQTASPGARHRCEARVCGHQGMV